MTGGAKRGAPNPWLLEEPEETRGLGFDEIRQQQQKIIQGTKYPKGVGSEPGWVFFFTIASDVPTPIENRRETVGLRELLALVPQGTWGQTDAVIHPGSCGSRFSPGRGTECSSSLVIPGDSRHGPLPPLRD